MTWWRRSSDKTNEASVEQQATKHYECAVSYCEQMRYADAERELRQALRLKPGYAEAHEQLSWVLERLDKRGVEQHAREAIRLRPDSAQLRADLGNRLLYEGNYTESERAYRDALQLDSGLGVALKGLAEVLQRQGKNKEAVAYWERAIKVEHNPKQVEWIKERLHAAQKQGGG